MSRRSREETGEQVFSKIAEERERRGLSRQDLADAVGIHYQTIGYLERGEYSPSLVLALRISEVLGRPIEALFSLSPFAKERVIQQRRAERS